MRDDSLQDESEVLLDTDDERMIIDPIFSEAGGSIPSGERKKFILVIYDIIDNRKILKLARALLGYGFRIQKSCFEAELTQNKYEKLIKELQCFGDEEDSIRIYSFHDRGQVTVIGKEEYTEMEDIIVI